MQWPLLYVPAFSVILKCQALVQREDIVYARVCATTDPHSRNFKMWEMSSGSTLQELVLRFARVSWTRLLDHGCLQDGHCSVNNLQNLRASVPEVIGRRRHHCKPRKVRHHCLTEDLV